nr:MAG TPA: hypothetical protein [Caudoviricetes sp.]
MRFINDSFLSLRQIKQTQAAAATMGSVMPASCCWDAAIFALVWA